MKIKLTICSSFIRKRLLLQIMKTFIFLLCTTVFSLNVENSFSQEKVTIDRDELVHVDRVFKILQKQTNFDFIYPRNLFKDTPKVQLKKGDINAAELLGLCLKNADLNFEISKNNTVIIKENNSSKVSILQGHEISGTVLDQQGQPLAGASILEKGTQNGAQTDFDGKFLLNVTSDSAVLVVSYLGFKTKEVVINGESEISVALEESTSDLDEVVVVGFGSQKRANISGSVSSVDLDDVLGDRPITTTLSSLQGTIPGLQIVLNSGEPGAEGSGFNIRGTTSINGGGPLVLVDNVPVSISDINPRDIKTVTVLKDAAASSIYGARAAFGVILITTKKPEVGKPKFTYALTTSVSGPTEIPQKASPLDFVNALNDWGRDVYWSLGQSIPVWKDLLEQYNTNPSAFPLGYEEIGGIRYHLEENDSVDELFGGLGFTQIHNASMSGGSENATYRLSLGYTDEDGFAVTDKDGLKRYNINAFTSVQIAPKIKTDLNLFYTNANRSIARIDYGGASQLPSFVPIGNHDNGDGTFTPYDSPANILRLNPANSSRESNFRLFTKTQYNPIENLTFSGEYTYEIKESEGIFVNTDPTLFRATRLTLSPNNNDNTRYTNSRGNSVYKGVNLYGNYDKSFGNHNFTLLTGYNYEESSISSLTASRLNLISTELPSIGGATGDITASDAFAEWAVMGVFGRLNYNYKEKYFLEVNGRYDGSSRFADGDRFGFFPSFSAAWNIAKESFMENQNLFSTLKLRGSWGEIGNQVVGGSSFNDQNYYPAVLGLPSFNSFWLDPSQVPHVTLGEPGLISAGFTWETVQSTNFGLDIAMLKNRLNATVEVYSRKTLDMITAGEELPAVLGTNPPVANAADLESKGWEIDVSWQDRIGEDFWYQVGVNVFDNEAKITKFNNEAGLLSQFYVGQTLGEIWGYETDGFYTVDDFVDGTLDANLRGGTLKDGVVSFRGRTHNPGDIKYKDLNGDGEIFSGNNTLEDPGDRRIIGNNRRRYQYGAFIKAGYKNFDFSLFLNGVGKRDLVLNSDLFWPFTSQFNNIYAHQLDYWTPTNTDAYFPRNYETDNSNYGPSRFTQTKYIQDGSYLAIRNITIGYTFSDKFLEKLDINNLRVFLSGENLINSDKLPDGLHPELEDRGRGATYPFQRKFAFGLNLSF